MAMKEVYNSAKSGNAGDIDSRVTCSSLSEVDFDILVSAYKVLTPQYELLAAQYKSAELQAIRHRCKSRFPSRAEWVHEGRTVTEQERILRGPSNAVIHRKKATVKDQHTGRVIEYNPIPESLSTVTTCSSFVRYKSKCEVPTIGCILILFEHSFRGKKYTLAVIRKYKSSARYRLQSLVCGRLCICRTTKDCSTNQ